MEYILCRFTYGYDGEFYQFVIDGVVINMYSIDGTLLLLPEDIPYGAEVVDPNPPIPSWVQN